MVPAVVLLRELRVINLDQPKYPVSTVGDSISWNGTVRHLLNLSCSRRRTDIEKGQSIPTTQSAYGFRRSFVSPSAVLKIFFIHDINLPTKALFD